MSDEHDCTESKQMFMESGLGTRTFCGGIRLGHNTHLSVKHTAGIICVMS